MALGLRISTTFDRSRPTYARIRSDFRVLNKEVDYFYKDRTHLQYIKKLTLKAQRSGMHCYVDKFNWTGRGDILMSSMIREHSLQELGQRNIWQLYQVNFGRNLRKGDTIDVAVKWDLKDPDGKAVPFFSQSVNEPTEKLTFRLRLPNSFNVRSVTRTVLPTIDALTPLSSENVAMRDDGHTSEDVWQPRRPQLLHCYQMSWVDPDVTPLRSKSLEELSEGPQDELRVVDPSAGT
jgi:hypothetical protein